MTNFNERRFLIRSLVVIFLIQFSSTGFQLSSCYRLSLSEPSLEKSSLICSQANESFAETSKLALTTLLALLVPAAAASVERQDANSRRKKPDQPSEG